MDISSYLRWDVVCMCIALAVVFGFEMAGVFGKHTITITALTRMYMPMSVRVMVWSWLGYHLIFGPQPK